MTTYIIPIIETTMDLVQMLNGDVRPEVDKNEERFFVYADHGSTSIIDRKTLNQSFEGNSAATKIMCCKQ